MEKRECQYIYHGPLGGLDTCTLSGHACLCTGDYLHCTRREYAMSYEIKHPKVPKQWAGVILTDGKGQVTNLI